MFDLPKNTMFTYLSNPMFDNVDMSEIPTARLVAEIEKFKAKNQKRVDPETDALKFYFLNHAFHTMKTKFNPLEPLDEKMSFVAEKHIQITSQIAKRLFFYNLIIAVEEAKFIPNQAGSFYDFMDDRYGEDFGRYVKANFPGSLTAFGKINMTSGEFGTAMVSVFGFGKWQPGFGGKGWAPIAALTSDCINGRISLEHLADQAFSLCHNNGSMFNKGHFYNCYSHFIYTVLDIQDSGQIPQWIASNKGNKFIDSELREVYDIMAERFPEEMTGKVDNSLIKNSQEKREKKAAAQAAHNHAQWNNQQKPPPKPHQHKMDQILVDIFKKGF